MTAGRDTTDEDFVWRGQRIGTIGHLTDAVGSVKSPEEAQDFLSQYRRHSPLVADTNVGYVTGYYGRERAEELRRWFNVPHPIFGFASPTFEQAFEAGRRIAAGEWDVSDG